MDNLSVFGSAQLIKGLIKDFAKNILLSIPIYAK